MINNNWEENGLALWLAANNPLLKINFKIG